MVGKIIHYCYGLCNYLLFPERLLIAIKGLKSLFNTNIDQCQGHLPRLLPKASIEKIMLSHEPCVKKYHKSLPY